MSYRLEFDGASRGNPGMAGAGACLINTSGQEVWAGWKFFDDEDKTCNEAEYGALILGLDECKKRNDVENLTLKICGDSQLVIFQMDGKWQVKDEKLKLLHHKAMDLVVSLRHEPSFHYIRREENNRADKLANLAIDSRRGGTAEQAVEVESGHHAPSERRRDITDGGSELFVGNIHFEASKQGRPNPLRMLYPIDDIFGDTVDGPSPNSFEPLVDVIRPKKAILSTFSRGMVS